MIKGKRIIAVIPARGGSKRLPKKNILILNDKPLIAWTIESALRSKYIDRVIVSSDDYDILDVAKKYKAECILRPEYLATDTATSNSVLMHILEENETFYDICILLQPTSPLRNETHIDECLELMLLKSADGIVSVTMCEHSPLWTNILPANGCLDNFISDEANRRSQELDDFYRINGAIYCFDVNHLELNKGISYDENVFSYVMDSNDSIDIDNEVDFKIATFFMETNKF
jgi:CMP-N,N'-diacetyllegionaminic acid synthase